MANRRRVFLFQSRRCPDALTTGSLVTGSLAGWLDGRGRCIGGIRDRSRSLLKRLPRPVVAQSAILRSLGQVDHIGLPGRHCRWRDAGLPHQRLVELSGVSKSTPRVFCEQVQKATHDTIRQVQSVRQHQPLGGMLLHDRFPGSGFERWFASQPLPPTATERVKIAGRGRKLIGQ
jgi:hypothetical protein